MKNLTPNQKIIFLKISRNILNISIFLWVAIFLTEILIPGFISSYLSFSKIIILITVSTSFLYLLSKSFNIEESSKKNKKNPYLWTIIITFLISIIASINFLPPIIILIAMTSSLIIFYLSKLIIEE